MRLREWIIICADAEAVWPLVADPVLQAEWNPKIVSVERKGSGPVRYGERFEMIYRMSGRENRSAVEVTVARRTERVVFLHRMGGASDARIVEEAYDIAAHADGVKVVQTIDLGRAGIPWVFRPLIWFISRFGWKAGEPYLERLRQLVERAMVSGR